MITVDKIGQIRRAFFERHLPIKEIVRTLSVSRATVRKVIRGKATEFRYESGLAVGISAAVAETMLLASSANCVTATGTTPEAQPKQWPVPPDRVPLPEPQYLGAEGGQIYLTDHSFWARHS